MEQLGIANHNLKAAFEKSYRDCEATMAKFDNKENDLKERLKQLNEKKSDRTHANLDAADDDLVEVNAGGKVVAAKRSTLTQLKGTRLEALFSGRWDKALQRDGNGRIFLDVNSACFQAIVDYLSELAISSEEDPPSPPVVGAEDKRILRSHLEMFGLYTPAMPESNIIKEVKAIDRLHHWLGGDGSDGELHLLYRSLRDGLSSASFHSKCDNQGCTLTVIETTDGFVLGGYSNTPWTCGGSFKEANKAFLFVLSGSDVTAPCKMKLKNANDGKAVYHGSGHGPIFGAGNDLKVIGSDVYLRFGYTYESGPAGRLTTPNDGGCYARFAIKEMEVFQVSGAPAPAAIVPKAKDIQPEVLPLEPVSIFSPSINEAINAKQESLLHAEMELLQLEESFEDEKSFIPTFACGDATDIVTLNVNGTMMTTKRSTLQSIEDSVLAQQFDDAKWTEQGCTNLRVKEWTADAVSAWADRIQGIQKDVGASLKNHGVNGCELLALDKDSLSTIGITRAATISLLLKEIKDLEKGTLIEHSPYCFGKILDHLRLKNLHLLGMAEEPSLPKICDAEKSRFEKVVKYYFPGDSSKLGVANHNLKVALGKRDRDLEAVLDKLDNKENDLKERLKQLNENKSDRTHANFDAADDDLVEVNAGGKIIAAKRSTLTQLKGSRFEALFSGRWDKALQRDGNDCIFLDVNPKCFRAIVDYLSELAISSEEDPPSPPVMGDEEEHIFRSHLELFGLYASTTKIPNSNIIKVKAIDLLHKWLREDGSDRELHLLYRSSRDGLSPVSFHSKCDNQGCTLTVIETTDGFVLGGYSNTPWTSVDNYKAADKAFLFVLSGNDVTSPCKMKLKNGNDGNAVYHNSGYGPTFGGGNDLKVEGSYVDLRFGWTYEYGPSGRLTTPNNGRYSRFAIKEMEVFRVSGTPAPPAIVTKARDTQQEVLPMEPVSIFTNAINEAINAKQESLLHAEMELLQLEESFKDEKSFIATFASGDAKDVVILNVNGTMMTTKRSTLQAIEDSVLAQQFDDSKWTEQGCANLNVEKWTSEDVSAWVKNVDEIPDHVADYFKEHEITGRGLLALWMGGLKEIGTQRGVHLERIAKLQSETLIEHSPYCFGKILDHLRLKHLHMLGMTEEPTLPNVCDAEKSRFEKVVRYYFPGDSAKAILG
ncbi:hypothetical protein ACHAWF_015682 [Thalassiosira exigua]